MEVVKYRAAFDPLNRAVTSDAGLRGIDLKEIDKPIKRRSRLTLYLTQEAPTEPFVKATAGMLNSEIEIIEKPLKRPVNGDLVKRVIVLRYLYPIHSLAQDLYRANLITTRQQTILLPEYLTPEYERQIPG